MTQKEIQALHRFHEEEMIEARNQSHMLRSINHYLITLTILAIMMVGIAAVGRIVTSYSVARAIAPQTPTLIAP